MVANAGSVCGSVCGSDRLLAGSASSHCRHERARQIARVCARALLLYRIPLIVGRYYLEQGLSHPLLFGAPLLTPRLSLRGWWRRRRLVIVVVVGAAISSELTIVPGVSIRARLE